MTEREVDEDLVRRAQRGEPRAFDLLVLKYQRRLMRLISRYLRDPAEVEDAAQEAFVKAYRALPNFRGDSAFYTWLYRIGINTAKNYISAGSRRIVVNGDTLDDEGEWQNSFAHGSDLATPEAELSNKQIVATVHAATEALPEELRTAITLRELEGLSYEEIARVMDCPIGTVRSRIFRAREAIAARLRPILETSEDRRW